MEKILYDSENAKEAMTSGLDSTGTSAGLSMVAMMRGRWVATRSSSTILKSNN